LLVRNMPLENPDLYGRMKDNLALLVEGIEFRLSALVVEMRMRSERANLVTAASLLNFVLSQVDTQFKRGQSEMSAIFSELENKLEWSFAGLVMTETQEQGLWNIVRPLAARAQALYESGVSLDQQIEGALQTLRTSLSESGEP
jgi:hypothetical protein